MDDFRDRPATLDKFGGRLPLYPAEAKGIWRTRRTRVQAVLIALFLVLPWIRINGAPALIAVCLTLEEMDRYPDARRNRAELAMAVQSAAMAAQNLLLAAHAEGYGTCWMCAPLFCAEAVQEALALPQSWEPQGLILLGRAAEPGRDRPRKPVDQIATGLSR